MNNSGISQKKTGSKPKNTNVLMACKLMPYYRIGVFQKLSQFNDGLKFYFFGDNKAEKWGNKPIPYEYSNPNGEGFIRWVKTNNYFYQPARLLWQTGVLKEIFQSKFKVFVFEGAIAHYPIWLYGFLCKLRGKTVLYWTHGNRGTDKGLKKILRKILFKWLGDGLLLYGNYQRHNMIKDGYNPDKLFVIYNSLQHERQIEALHSLDKEKVEQYKRSLFEIPELFTLIFIGRLVKHKGVLDILRAVKMLKDSGYPINCIFIGDGEEKDCLKKFTSMKLLNGQIHFVGSLYEEEKIAKYFAMADMMISPGNVGLNCIHSLAYGVPVITHNNFHFQNPEVEALKDGITGLFFEHNNFDDMVSKLKLWIENSCNNKLIKENCQKIIYETYNSNMQTKCMVAAIRKISNL